MYGKHKVFFIYITGFSKNTDWVHGGEGRVYREKSEDEKQADKKLSTSVCD